MTSTTKPSTFIATMLWGQVGRMSELVLGFLINIVIVRTLATDTYGAYSTIINLISFVNFFSALGLSESLTRYTPLGAVAPKPYQLALLRRLLTIRFVAGLTGGLLLLLGGAWLSHLFNAPEVSEYSWILPALALTFSLMDFLMYFYTASFRLKETAWLRPLIQLLSFLVLLGWFWLVSPSLLAVLVITLLSNTFLCLGYLLRLPVPRLFTQKEAKLPGHEIFRYSRTLWLSSLCSFGLSGFADIIIIGVVLNDQTQVAYYALVYMILTRVQAFTTGWQLSINSIAATILLEKGKEGLSRYFGYYYKLNLFINLFIFGLFVVVSNALILLIFGNRYQPSVPIMLWYGGHWLNVGLLGGGIGFAFSNILGKQNLVLGSRFILGILNLVLEIFLLLWIGLVGAVIATVAANILMHAFELYLIRDLKLAFPFGFIAKMVMLTAIAALSGWLLVSNSLLGLLIGTTIYGLVWIGGLGLTKPIEATDKQVLLNWQPRLARFIQFLS